MLLVFNKDDLFIWGTVVYNGVIGLKLIPTTESLFVCLFVCLFACFGFVCFIL